MSFNWKGSHEVYFKSK